MECVDLVFLLFVPFLEGLHHPTHPLVLQAIEIILELFELLVEIQILGLPFLLQNLLAQIILGSYLLLLQKPDGFFLLEENLVKLLDFIVHDHVLLPFQRFVLDLVLQLRNVLDCRSVNRFVVEFLKLLVQLSRMPFDDMP